MLADQSVGQWNLPQQTGGIWTLVGLKWKGTVTFSAIQSVLSFTFYNRHHVCVVWLRCVYPHVGTGLWQVAPDQPLTQMQENWFTSSKHVPPFKHGEDAHSLMSEDKDTKKTYTKNLHLNKDIFKPISLMLELHRIEHHRTCELRWWIMKQIHWGDDFMLGAANV